MPENAWLPRDTAKVTAVVPVHNRADLLRRMLETASTQTLRFAEIIAVDNASADDAPRVAREFGCRVIRMADNAGFAKGVNTGWRAASTEWIAVLNSDVELDPNWLARLTECAAATGASFATGLILDATARDRIDGSCDLVSRAGCAWRAGHGEELANTRPRKIDIAPGTACIFRRDVLERLGGYDESFESYLEDVDLGLRCVRSGLSGMFVPGALCWHHGSATLGRWHPRVVRLISRNQLLLIARHFDRDLFRRCLWPVIVGQLLWGVVAARHGAALAWLQGKSAGFRGFRLRAEPSPSIAEFLDRSEAEIRGRACDAYWRWYFRLAGYGSASH